MITKLKNTCQSINFQVFKKKNCTIKNSIVFDILGTAIEWSKNDYNNLFGNRSNYGNTSGGVHNIFINPLNNGLKYLPRIEQDSVLATSGEGGGQIGATIIKRLGKSGSLYGDSGRVNGK